ncbi:MAG: hypothetical protein LQ346_000989 [Caloplaca aetnensis]|nr:MAG: hypothetical protein LQ346_000989 [Caloplaca aetnensis]
MEPPLKRRRLFTSDNPDDELLKRRSRCDMKLKSRFESIFAKYSKDFSDVGDVIDFQKDEIVVNNGHVRNMINETDIGDQDCWSVQQADVSLGGDSGVPTVDTGEKLGSDVIPDSQDFDSSDDDPLGMLEDAIQTRVSSLSKVGIISTPNRRQWGSSNGKPRTTKTNHTFNRDSHDHVSSALQFDGFLRFRDESPVEEAWRVPPLPKDSHVGPGLPSPSPSDQEDTETSRSASPPGLSIWAPEKRRNRSAWTQDEDGLLTYYRTRTDLTYEAICECLPNRSASSLRVRWGVLDQETRAVASSPCRNSWTLEENQLLQELKTSSDMTLTEIQRQIPRHSQAAISCHWHLLRQKLVDKPSSGGPWPADATALRKVDQVHKAPLEHVQTAQDSPTKSASTRLTPRGIESYPANSSEDKQANMLIAAVEVEPDYSGPRSVYVERKQKKFPPGTIVADSQGAGDPQYHSDESQDQRVELQNSVISVEQEDDHDKMPQILPSARDVTSTRSATRFEAYSTDLDRRLYQVTAAAPPHKRKRVADDGGKYIERIEKAPEPARGVNYESEDKFAVDKHVIEEKLGYSRDITSKEVIVIDSSPEPPSLPLGSQSRPEHTDMEDEALNCAYGRPGHNHKPGPSVPETHVSSGDSGTDLQAKLQQSFGLSTPQRSTSCMESNQEGLDPDQPRTPEGDSRSRIQSPYAGQMRGSPQPSGQKLSVPLCRQLRNPLLRSEDWERIRAQVRSREAVPSQENLGHPFVSSRRLDLAASEGTVPEKTAFEPRISGEGQMVNDLGPTERLLTSLPDTGPVGSAVEFPVAAIPPKHHDVAMPLTLGDAASGVENDTIEPNSDEAERRATELVIKIPLSAAMQTSPREQSQAKKAILQRPQNPTDAATSPCRRFRYVEIPMLSSTTSESRTAPWSTDVLVNKARESSPQSTHSSNGFSDEKLPSLSSIPGIDHDQGSGAPQDHEPCNVELIPPHTPLEYRQETAGEQRDIEDLGQPEVVIDEYEAVVEGSESIVDEAKAAVDKESIAVVEESKAWPENQSVIDESRFAGHSSLPEGSPALQKGIWPSGDDEDDLQLSFHPVVARGPTESRQRTSTGGACRLVLRTKLDEADMSDDELSTPSKARCYHVEMTPVRSLRDSGSRLPILF